MGFSVGYSELVLRKQLLHLLLLLGYIRRFLLLRSTPWASVTCWI
jgi:RING-H2 zinc finger protein RHA1